MPFDMTPTPETKHAKLLWLADVLEDRTKWPEGFVWDYRSCPSCAIGLAYSLGQVPCVSGTASLTAESMADAGFVSDDDAAVDLFAAGNGSGHRVLAGHYRKAITPSMVASAIRQYVSEN